MPVRDVMRVGVVTVRPEETVQAAIARMVEKNVGAVAVCEGPRLVGMFTERDVLRLVGAGVDPASTLVRDHMTTRLVTVAADDDILGAALLMGEHSIRHLPVVEGENLHGIVGIRDLLGVLAEKVWSGHDAEARETIRRLLAREPRVPAAR